MTDTPTPTPILRTVDDLTAEEIEEPAAKFRDLTDRLVAGMREIGVHITEAAEAIRSIAAPVRVRDHSRAYAQPGPMGTGRPEPATGNRRSSQRRPDPNVTAPVDDAVTFGELTMRGHLVRPARHGANTVAVSVVQAFPQMFDIFDAVGAEPRELRIGPNVPGPLAMLVAVDVGFDLAAIDTAAENARAVLTFELDTRRPRPPSPPRPPGTVVNCALCGSNYLKGDPLHDCRPRVVVVGR